MVEKELEKVVDWELKDFCIRVWTTETRYVTFPGVKTWRVSDDSKLLFIETRIVLDRHQELLTIATFKKWIMVEVIKTGEPNFFNNGGEKLGG